MTRCCFMFVLANLMAVTLVPAQETRNLVTNAGFEDGTRGWILVMGGYGEQTGDWGKADNHARIVEEPVHAGRHGLALDAIGLDNEVDVYSQPIPVAPDHGYRLQSFVRQTGGKDGYKVTLEWQTSEGKHLRYDNDWRGSNNPKEFQPHGGIFASPAEARRAVLILGVQKGVRCVFDDLSLTDLGLCEPLGARPRHDGDGKVEITGPARVEAKGLATWKVVYTCGDSGLPAGGSIVLRRWPVSFDWSAPQDSRPRDEGFVSAKGPRGAVFEVTAGQAQAMTVKLLWPALLPGEKVEINLGDRGQGGPGMRVQGKLTTDARWIAASDCDAEGKYRDLPETLGGHFDISPGPPVSAWMVTPAVAFVGEPTQVRLEVRNAAGNPTDQFEGRCRLSYSPAEPGLPASVHFTRGTTASRTMTVKWSKPGLYALKAAAEGLSPTRQKDSDEAWVVVSEPLPAIPSEARGAWSRITDHGAVLANEHVALLFPRNRNLPGWGCAAVTVRQSQGWKKVAVLPAIGRVSFRGQQAGIVRKSPGALFFAKAAKAAGAQGKASIALSGTVRSGRGEWPFTATYALSDDSSSIIMRLSVQVRSQGSLVAMQSPVLYAGDGTSEERKAGALFPGLEFLTSEEFSSDDEGVAWSIRKRRIPHPYKITVPLMAVAGDNSVVGLRWDPLQKWDGKRSVPLAQFGSPNREEGKSDHLMALCLPGLIEGFTENVAGVAGGWSPSVGTELSLTSDLFALPGTTDVADAVRSWVETHSLPQPEPPRSMQESLALSVRGVTETAWDAKSKGWISAIGWKSGFQGDLADLLVQAAVLCENRQVAESARTQAQEALKAAGGPQGVALNLRTGNAEEAVAALRQVAYGAIACQHPEGHWTFADAYSTESEHAVLAQPQEVEIGTCVNELEPVLTYAVATGDPRAVEAGLHGLEYIKRFYKPAGSESWEVPLVCPNLRAAALATRCFLRGWQLTGRGEYLQLARRWAWAGASFLYLWQAPDRPVMPGASISVMGTTFYSHPWFGAAVQWVGLVYAEALQELAKFDESYDWRRLAELILASALHQQKTEKAACRHVGFMPDSYSVVQGKDYYEWCLAPAGILSNLIGSMGYSPGACVTAVKAGDRSVHVLSVARATQGHWDPGGNTLSMKLHSMPGQSSQVVLFGLVDPKRVTWEGKELDQLAESSDLREGWFTPPMEHALVMRLRWSKQEGEIVAEGATLVDYRAPNLADRIPNGDFEHGVNRWHCEPAATVDREHPHLGQAALLIDAPDPQKEVQATSSPMRVEGGKSYRLRSWVLEMAGEGNYKVTIDWLDANGQHLAFENDWRGTNRPRTYQEHGGVFQSPARAARACIILGCRGARCLFDDISLEPAW